MRPSPPLVLFLLLILFLKHAPAQDLPTKSAPLDPIQEANALIEGLESLATSSVPAPPPVGKAEARLEAARRKMDRWEKLARQGVVSRMEAETAAMDFALANLVCEQARLLQARADQQPEAVATAETKAAAAQTELNRVRLEITRRNLGRFRQLYAERLVTRTQVQRLEATVAELERIAATPPAAPAPSAPPLPSPPAAP